MLKFNSKQAIIGSVKSLFSIKFPFYIFAIGILLTFSAFQCEDEEWCAEPNCETILVCEAPMITNVTVGAVICGVGVWENLWLNDGSKVYLQPYSLASNVEKIELKDKMKLKISFQYTEKDNRYDDIITCEAYPGESKPITILSIEVVDK